MVASRAHKAQTGPEEEEECVSNRTPGPPRGLALPGLPERLVRLLPGEEVWWVLGRELLPALYSAPRREAVLMVSSPACLVAFGEGAVASLRVHGPDSEGSASFLQAWVAGSPASALAVQLCWDPERQVMFVGDGGTSFLAAEMSFIPGSRNAVGFQTSANSYLKSNRCSNTEGSTRELAGLRSASSVAETPPRPCPVPRVVSPGQGRKCPRVLICAQT